jgi:c-di-GMP-binding flagellar brake protein YcgR
MSSIGGADACQLLTLLGRPYRFPMEAGAVKTEARIEEARAESVSTIQAEPNRRKTQRFPCQGAAEVSVLGGALRFSGEVHDLSATGCCVLTKVIFTLERGTAVEVTLVVNRVHFRVAAGVRTNRYTRCVGLEFTNVSERCARLIQELIVELASKGERELVGVRG